MKKIPITGPLLALLLVIFCLLSRHWIESVEEEIEGTEDTQVSYRLVDLKSTNGTFLNEKKVEEEILKHADQIRIGFVTFKFIDENIQTFEETTKVHKSWIPGVYYTK